MRHHMKYTALFIVLCSLNVFVFANTEASISNDVKSDDPELDPAQMIVRSGYPAEAHYVTTEDGYILTVHRIPPTRSASNVGKGRPVLLQHGLLSSSADWLILGPNHALPYLLSDLGFDVWLGNARGNTYSRAHVTLSASDVAFWNFTWHEMGYYDLPAVTEFILKSSEHQQLIYVGHSMGTTMFWVFCTTRPELQNRIHHMHALAPVAFMSRMRSPLRNLAPFVRELQITLAALGEHEFLPHGEVRSFLVEEFLRINHIAAEGAEYVFFSICGFDPSEFNKTLLPTILGHTPAGASTQSVLHYLQEVQSAKFRQYDEGTQAGNKRRYGVPEPPEYDLSKLEVPVAMQYSLNDWLSNTDDVKELFEKLKNPIGLFKVNLSTFNHLDYMWATDARKLVYKRIINIMQSRFVREREEQVSKIYDETVKKFHQLSAKAEPSYEALRQQIQYYTEKGLQETARRWGPVAITKINNLQKRLEIKNRDVSEPKTSELAKRGTSLWYDEVMKRYPQLLTAELPTLYVKRMLSSLAQKIEKEQGGKSEEQARVNGCACGGFPSHACCRNGKKSQCHNM